MYPLATVMLEEDQLLNRMRFDLVPKQSVFSQFPASFTLCAFICVFVSVITWKMLPEKCGLVRSTE